MDLGGGRSLNWTEVSKQLFTRLTFQQCLNSSYSDRSLLRGWTMPPLSDYYVLSRWLVFRINRSVGRTNCFRLNSVPSVVRTFLLLFIMYKRRRRRPPSRQWRSFRCHTRWRLSIFGSIRFHPTKYPTNSTRSRK